MSDISRPCDLVALARLSARIGRDPLLIQGAGGNTSVKDGGVMWIKASGTLLAEAEARDVFVPVDLEPMRAAVAARSGQADRPGEFALGTSGLRPSIETCLHALFAQRVVVHVHCVQTLAHAVRVDAQTLLADRLGAFDWCLVPYARPGAALAALVAERLGPATDVVVLGNHGLIVAAETVAEAEALLGQVVAALRLEPAAPLPPDMARLERIAAGWEVPQADAPLHQVALEPDRLRQATAGSLYPDHVIFCGVGATALDGPVPDPAEGPPFLLVPGRGALVRPGASAGAVALARCLGDVLMRVPGDAVLNYLTAAENAALLDWDAEKYRQALNAG